MEIQVGEYVRNKCGAIRKFKGYLNEEMYISSLNYEDAIVNHKTDKLLLDSSFGGASIGCFKDIVKHSFNIIDLIEEGDYVNGYKVLDIDFKNEMICLLMPFDEENKSKYNIVWNTKYFIKSIVTKQQMEAMGYEVK